MNISNMSESSPPDDWGIASAAYATTVQQITRPSAEALISWVHEESPLSAPDTAALDNGAGSGVVTTTLRSQFPKLPIVAADLSPGMLETIEKKSLPRVECQVLDAVDLSPIADETFTHTFNTFMLQFTADPLQALREMYRVTKPGGTLGLCMWGKLCFNAPWEEAVRNFEPDYTYPHSWTPNWADEGRIRARIEEAGFSDVRVRTTWLKWDFESPQQFVEFFLESKNPEFMRGYQPWWDMGMEDVMRPMFERVARERYGGDKNFDFTKIFLFVARKY